MHNLILLTNISFFFLYNVFVRVKELGENIGVSLAFPSMYIYINENLRISLLTISIKLLE
jgi:hypothetical protein